MVRLILKKEATPDDIRHADGSRKSTSTKLRRVLKMRLLICGRCRNLRIAAGCNLAYGRRQPGETVIEAKELTKKFGDFAAPITSTLPLNAGRFLVCWGQRRG